MFNIEEDTLMYILALPEVFAEYLVTPAEYTTLESGKIFTHASKCGRMILDSRHDNRVDYHTNNTLQAYIEYVDGYATEKVSINEN